jgi:hypothetical protein
MNSFSKTLERVLSTSGYTATQVCSVSGLTKHNFSNLIAGRREIGPKTLAALLGVFERKEQQRLLIVAFLGQALNEVNAHVGDPKNRWKMKQLLSDRLESTGSEIPLWLEQLVEEAVVAGESDPEVLALVQDLFEAVLKGKPDRQNSQKSKS